MATNAVYLKDKAGNVYYPVTDVSLVTGLQEGAIMESVIVDSLPTASSSTVGKIYMIESETEGEYDRYLTTYANSAYTWTQLGSTAILSPTIADNLTTNDATKALSAKQGKVLNEELSQLGLYLTEEARYPVAVPSGAKLDENTTVSGTSSTTDKPWYPFRSTASYSSDNGGWQFVKSGQYGGPRANNFWSICPAINNTKSLYIDIDVFLPSTFDGNYNLYILLQSTSQYITKPITTKGQWITITAELKYNEYTYASFDRLAFTVDKAFAAEAAVTFYLRDVRIYNGINESNINYQFEQVEGEITEANANIATNTDNIATNTDNIGIERYLQTADEIVSSYENGFAAFHDASVSFIDNYFHVDCSSSAQTFPGIRNDVLGAHLAGLGKSIIISFRAKLFASSPVKPLMMYVSGSAHYEADITTEWKRYEFQIDKTELSAISRIQICFILGASESQVSGLGFDIKDFEVSTVGVIGGRLITLENQVSEINEVFNPSKFEGKKISVIGDSISTISGNNNSYWIVKSVDVGQTIQSYVTWWDIYADEGGTIPTNKSIGGVTLTTSMIGALQTFTPVAGDVGKTIGTPLNYNAASTKVWTQKLCELTGATLLANASWSGARICDGQTGTYQLSHAWSDYTIGCCKTRDNSGNDVLPDVVIVYRGTNDFSHSPVSRIDDVSLSNGIPASDYINSLYQFKAGYYKTIQKLRAAYPQAYIVCCTLNVFKRGIYDVFPTRNTYYTLPEMNDAIREVANTMGCGLIEFDKDGITFENCYSGGYITDSSTMPTHPNSKGHEVMAYKALADLRYLLNQ